MASRKGETKKDHLKWMLTFSDMMTLLLAFFVLLISMSSLDQEKLKKVLDSMKGSLGVLELGSFSEISISVDEDLETGFLSQDVLTPEYYKWLKGILQEITKYSGIDIKATEVGYIISISNELLFDPGSARLKESAKRFLDEIQKLFKTGINHVEVQGFTDDLPIRGGRFSSNWDLSAARAVSVLKYMVRNGFEPEKFIATAFGETRPIYPNISPVYRAKNRRVELVVDSPIGQLNLLVREMTGGNP